MTNKTRPAPVHSPVRSLWRRSLTAGATWPRQRRALGLEEGDAHVIRNAGGAASEAIRSLAISQQLLGTREIVLIHHTDCGMLTVTDDQIRQRLGESLGPEAAAAAAEITFQPFANVERSVHDDLEIIRSSPLIRPGTPVTGFVYDVRSGRLNPVE